MAEADARSRARPLGVILAGGAATRLGGSKAELDLGGRPLISAPIAAARAAGLTVVVVGKPDTRLPELDVPVHREPELPRHPLLGVTTGLELAQAGAGPDGAIVAIACDMPFVTPELVSWLATQSGTVVPRLGTRLQPLCARYEPDALEPLCAAVANGSAAQDAAAGVADTIAGEGVLAQFGDVARLFFNVNTEEDLAEARLLAPE